MVTFAVGKGNETHLQPQHLTTMEATGVCVGMMGMTYRITMCGVVGGGYSHLRASKTLQLLLQVSQFNKRARTTSSQSKRLWLTSRPSPHIYGAWAKPCCLAFQRRGAPDIALMKIPELQRPFCLKKGFLFCQLPETRVPCLLIEIHLGWEMCGA